MAKGRSRRPSPSKKANNNARKGSVHSKSGKHSTLQRNADEAKSKQLVLISQKMSAKEVKPLSNKAVASTCEASSSSASMSAKPTKSEMPKTPPDPAVNPQPRARLDLSPSQVQKSTLSAILPLDSQQRGRSRAKATIKEVKTTTSDASGLPSGLGTIMVRLRFTFNFDNIDLKVFPNQLLSDLESALEVHRNRLRVEFPNCFEEGECVNATATIARPTDESDPSSQTLWEMLQDRDKLNLGPESLLRKLRVARLVSQNVLHYHTGHTPPTPARIRWPKRHIKPDKVNKKKARRRSGAGSRNSTDNARRGLTRFVDMASASAHAKEPGLSSSESTDNDSKLELVTESSVVHANAESVSECAKFVSERNPHGADKADVAPISLGSVQVDLSESETSSVPLSSISPAQPKGHGLTIIPVVMTPDDTVSDSQPSALSPHKLSRDSHSNPFISVPPDSAVVHGRSNGKDRLSRSQNVSPNSSSEAVQHGETSRGDSFSSAQVLDGLNTGRVSHGAVLRVGECKSGGVPQTQENESPVSKMLELSPQEVKLGFLPNSPNQTSGDEHAVSHDKASDVVSPRKHVTFNLPGDKTFVFQSSARLKVPGTTPYQLRSILKAKGSFSGKQHISRTGATSEHQELSSASRKLVNSHPAESKLEDVEEAPGKETQAPDTSVSSTSSLSTVAAVTMEQNLSALASTLNQLLQESDANEASVNIVHPNATNQALDELAPDAPRDHMSQHVPGSSTAPSSLSLGGEIQQTPSTTSSRDSRDKQTSDSASATDIHNGESQKDDRQPRANELLLHDFSYFNMQPSSLLFTSSSHSPAENVAPRASNYEGKVNGARDRCENDTSQSLPANRRNGAPRFYKHVTIIDGNTQPPPPLLFTNSCPPMTQSSEPRASNQEGKARKNEVQQCFAADGSYNVARFVDNGIPMSIAANSMPVPFASVQLQTQNTTCRGATNRTSAETPNFSGRSLAAEVDRSPPVAKRDGPILSALRHVRRISEGREQKACDSKSFKTPALSPKSCSRAPVGPFFTTKQTNPAHAEVSSPVQLNPISTPVISHQVDRPYSPLFPAPRVVESTAAQDVSFETKDSAEDNNSDFAENFVAQHDYAEHRPYPHLRISRAPRGVFPHSSQSNRNVDASEHTENAENVYLQQAQYFEQRRREMRSGSISSYTSGGSPNIRSPYAEHPRGPESVTTSDCTFSPTSGSDATVNSRPIRYMKSLNFEATADESKAHGSNGFAACGLPREQVRHFDIFPAPQPAGHTTNGEVGDATARDLNSEHFLHTDTDAHPEFLCATMPHTGYARLNQNEENEQMPQGIPAQGASQSHYNPANHGSHHAPPNFIPVPCFPPRNMPHAWSNPNAFVPFGPLMYPQPSVMFLATPFYQNMPIPQLPADTSLAQSNMSGAPQFGSQPPFGRPNIQLFPNVNVPPHQPFPGPPPPQPAFGLPHGMRATGSDRPFHQDSYATADTHQNMHRENYGPIGSPPNSGCQTEPGDQFENSKHGSSLNLSPLPPRPRDLLQRKRYPSSVESESVNKYSISLSSQSCATQVNSNSSPAEKAQRKQAVSDQVDMPKNAKREIPLHPTGSGPALQILTAQGEEPRPRARDGDSAVNQTMPHANEAEGQVSDCNQLTTENEADFIRDPNASPPAFSEEGSVTPTPPPPLYSMPVIGGRGNRDAEPLFRPHGEPPRRANVSTANASAVATEGKTPPLRQHDPLPQPRAKKRKRSIDAAFSAIPPGSSTNADQGTQIVKTPRQSTNRAFASTAPEPSHAKAHEAASRARKSSRRSRATTPKPEPISMNTHVSRSRENSSAHVLCHSLRDVSPKHEGFTTRSQQDVRIPHQRWNRGSGKRCVTQRSSCDVRLDDLPWEMRYATVQKLCEKRFQGVMCVVKHVGDTYGFVKFQYRRQAQGAIRKGLILNGDTIPMAMEHARGVKVEK